MSQKARKIVKTKKHIKNTQNVLTYKYNTYMSLILLHRNRTHAFLFLIFLRLNYNPGTRTSVAPTRQFSLFLPVFNGVFTDKQQKPMFHVKHC